MSEPIKLPPLPAGRWVTDAGWVRRAFFGNEVETYAGLAVEQNTAALHAERDALRAALEKAEAHFRDVGFMSCADAARAALKETQR